MSHAQIDFSKLKVLVLDDSKLMRKLIRDILLCYGCKDVVLASSVPDAISALDVKAVDLALVDWFMEPIEGIEFVRQVRASVGQISPYLPIIMLTGHSEVERVREARDAGANDFLVKPVSGDSIYRRIVSLVEDTRPFIRTPTFLGPDRRRNDLGPPMGMADRRRG